MTRLSLDVIQIDRPCDADWDAMSGDDARRFCESCQLQVHNLSAMSRRDAEQVVQSGRSGRVCVQIQRDHRGRVLTREDFRWGRQLRRKAGFIRRQVLLSLAAGWLSMVGAGCGQRDDSSPGVMRGDVGVSPPGMCPPVAGGIMVLPEDDAEQPVIGEMMPEPLVEPERLGQVIVEQDTEPTQGRLDPNDR